MEEVIVVNWIDDDGNPRYMAEVESIDEALTLIDRKASSIAEESIFCAPGPWEDYPEDEPDGRERKRIWLEGWAKEQGCEPIAEIIRFKLPGQPKQAGDDASGSPNDLVGTQPPIQGRFRFRKT